MELWIKPSTIAIWDEEWFVDIGYDGMSAEYVWGCDIISTSSVNQQYNKQCTH